MAPPAPSRAYGSNHLAHYDLRAERVLTIPYEGWGKRPCPGAVPSLTSLRQARVVLSCQAPYSDSDHAGDRSADARSRTGVMILLNGTVKAQLLE